MSHGLKLYVFLSNVGVSPNDEQNSCPEGAEASKLKARRLRALTALLQSPVFIVGFVDVIYWCEAIRLSACY